MAKMGESKIEVASNVSFKPVKSSFRESAGDKMGKLARSFFDSIQVIVVALAIVVLVYLFVASFNIVDGDSMLPNFHTGDLIISEKITTSWGKLERGDVVVFNAPSGKDYIKRVIGLPGDRVKIQGGKVYVNSIRLNEPYLSAENQIVPARSKLADGVELTTPQDQYILLGDNRNNSQDSRDLGPIEKGRIKGKAWIQIWSQQNEKFRSITHVRYPELEK